MVDSTESGTRYRWRVLYMTFLAYLYDSLDLQILAICLPVIIASLGLSLTDAGLLASATMIGTALGGVIFGWVAENWGRKNAAVICLIEFGIFTAAVYWVTSWEQLMVLRFLQGIGMGGLWGPIVALIADHWAPKYRARAAGFMLSTFAVGGIVASLMGRYLLNDLGWRMLFAIVGSAAIVGILFWIIVPPDPPRAAKANQPRIGFGQIFAPNVVFLTIGATLAAACQMGGFWGVSSWIPTYLVNVRGMEIEYMSLFSVVIFSGAFVGYFVFAWLADTIGRRNALIIAFLADTVIVPLYVIVPDPKLLFWLGPLMGLSFGGVFGLFGSYFAELFPQEVRAMGSGFAFNIGRGIGAVVTPVTVGALAKTHGLGFGIGACSVLFFTGAVIVWFMPETLRQESRQQVPAMH